MSTKPKQDTFFLSLCRRAVEKLAVEWPSPLPTQKPLRFAGFFLPPKQTTVKNNLPLFPDFVSELTSTWNTPLSTRIMVPGYEQYLDLDGADKAVWGDVDICTKQASHQPPGNVSNFFSSTAFLSGSDRHVLVRTDNTTVAS